MNSNGMRHSFADRPTFAIIGWTLQGGETHGRVRVVASRTLSTADLEVRREGYGKMWGTLGEPVYTHGMSTVITVETSDFMMIEAENWRAIMEALHRQWAV